MNMASLFFFGSTAQILMKYQNETTYLEDDGKYYKWKHPFYGTLLTSFGQSFTMIFSFIKKRNDRRKAQLIKDLNGAEIDSSAEPEKKLDVKLLAIPAICDQIENSTKNITLTLIAASITQMLRSAAVVFTAILAVLFLK